MRDGQTDTKVVSLKVLYVLLAIGSGKVFKKQRYKQKSPNNNISHEFPHKKDCSRQATALD